ncbi:MAG: Crp/Fnr family transcriptional regulator, partial [Planctomycetaceae bacterium]
RAEDHGESPRRVPQPLGQQVIQQVNGRRLAVELTHISAVALDDLRSVLGEAATVHLLNDLLAERLRHTSRALAVVLRAGIQQRIASRLCDLATRHGRTVGEGTRLAVRVTQEDLARMTGSSRETVNKTIARFARRGWVTSAGGRYVLRDVGALQRFAGV